MKYILTAGGNISALLQRKTVQVAGPDGARLIGDSRRGTTRPTPPPVHFDGVMAQCFSGQLSQDPLNNTSPLLRRLSRKVGEGSVAELQLTTFPQSGEGT
ncbi:MAG: hypothetical protein ACR2JC_17265 [Chloroflexota bacterium]|nr:MAG: hypothetical protein DLM70_05320 [Chloroflexota bacterium]